MKPLDRNAVGPALTIGAVLWIAGLVNAPAGEHDRTAAFSDLLATQARAQEPAVPTEEATPPGEHSIAWGDVGHHEPQIVGPELTPAGTFLEFTLDQKPPKGADVKLRWTLNGEADEAHLRVSADQLTATVASDDGSGELKVHGLWGKTVADATIVDDVHSLKFGPPPPAKPLAELAGKDRETLAELYKKLLVAQEFNASPDAFLADHSKGLDDAKLTGHGATDEIASRLEKAIGHGGGELDHKKLVTCLNQIVKDLGADPTPPPNPPGPLSPLAALVPDPAHRALIAEFYADMAAAVRAGQFANTTHFRTGYRESFRLAQDSGALPIGLSAIDKPISDRIATAIGLTADVPIDPAKKTALAIVLESVATEFKG